MLMDIRGSIQPTEDLDIKTRVIEHDQLWFTEARLALQGLLVAQQKIPQQLPNIQIGGGIPMRKPLPRDAGET